MRSVTDLFTQRSSAPSRAHINFALAVTIAVTLIPADALGFEVRLFDNSNSGQTSDCPNLGTPLAPISFNCTPEFTLTRDAVITGIRTYHRNPPADVTIDLWSEASGMTVNFTTHDDLDVAPGASLRYRIADIPGGSIDLPAGTYLVDVPPSSGSLVAAPSSWQQNSGSSDKGFAIVTGAYKSGG